MDCFKLNYVQSCEDFYIQQHAPLRLLCGKVLFLVVNMMIVNISVGFLVTRVSIGSEVPKWNDKLDVK